MNIARPVSCLAACLVLTLAAHAQQTPTDPALSACGSTKAKFSVNHSRDTSITTQAPTGKALVYVIEVLTHSPYSTSKVNIGVDGAWIGTTVADTHLRFSVDPGVHHLCAVFQGQLESMDTDGRTLLLPLNAQAGHTYYLRYHAHLDGTNGIAFFEPINDDQGLHLVLNTDAMENTNTATSKPSGTDRFTRYVPPPHTRN